MFSGLTNGTQYQYRVRQKGNPSTGPWSDWTTVTPEQRYRPNPPYSRGGAQPQDHPVHGPRIRFHAAGDVPHHFSVNAQINIRFWGPGSDEWRILPFKQKGQPTKYEIHRRYRVHNGHGIFEPVVTGLQPGTTYYFMFQGVNGDIRSEWTEQQSLTTRGEAPPGSTPTNPPPVKAPPKDLVATVNNSSVELSWTPSTNPNYTEQNILRRIAGERPINWTKFPVNIDANSHTDSSGVSGITYIYRVEALKANGKGGMTNPQEVTFP